MGMVHAAQTGQLKSPSAKVKQLANTMTKKSAADFASTKHKGLPAKVKSEGQYDNTVGNVYLVLRPDTYTNVQDMVKEIDPVMGCSHSGIDHQTVYGAYKSIEEAQKAAEKAHADHITSMKKLEEKKGTVTTKLQKAIDKLEKERKDHMKMAKDNPKDAGTHKSHVEAIETKIKNLMDKLEKVEKAKKPIEEEDDSKKKELSENIQKGDTVEKKFASTEEDYTTEYEVLDINKNGKAKLKNKKTGNITLIYTNDLSKINENKSNNSLEVGDKVKIDKNYGGGTSRVKEISGSFIVLDNGKSYHISNLTKVK
jgi:DNA repair exonuclease SbcCD ATPase subunit